MMPLFIVAIIVFLVIPMPTWLLDILLAANISISLMILLVVIYTLKPLEFSVFPGILLVTTLFRLSLNVSSTRLILSQGYAGEVVATFGSFVTMGNIIVGVVIFIILVIIQFVVITKGSGRIAEVAARFTLDAMPGKQMAIDADMNAGLIDEATARQRREEIRREADFYGAMDGASKFVRGDAIAGIIITIINIIGGIIIGLVMGAEQLTFLEVLEKYTILTIGDGLVSQLPSLMISTGAGIIVARASSTADLGTEVIEQLFSNSKALFVAAGVLLGFSLVPGLPFIPFFVIAAGLGLIGFVSVKSAKKKSEEQDGTSAKAKAESQTGGDSVNGYLIVDQMEFEIGYALISLVDSSQGGDLLERIALIRKQIAIELGFKVPPIRIRDNFELKPNEYVLKIKGVEVARAELMPGYYLIMDPGTATKKIDGIPTKEPTYGIDAVWVTESQKQEADRCGYTVVELPAVVTTHMTEIIKKHAQELLTREDVKELVDNVKKHNAAVVEEVIPSIVKLGDVQKVLANLLWERVSIRDLSTILETLGDYGKSTTNPDILTEYVRHSLSRQITNSLLSHDKKLRVVTLSSNTEKLLEQNLHSDNKDTLRIVLQPNQAIKLSEAVKQAMDKLLMRGLNPILLTSTILRLQIKRVLEPYIHGITVVSVTEITNEFEVVSEGEVEVGLI